MLVTIGQITAPQGIKGEVRVLPLTDFPERFRSLSRVFLACPEMGKEPRQIRITDSRPHKRFFLVKIEGVDSREEAEKLRNCYLQVEMGEVVSLPPGHYYHFQIIGLRVETLDGELLGRVREILTSRGNDVYLVRDNTGREILIPAIKQVVREIDLEKGLMWVDLLPGLR